MLLQIIILNGNNLYAVSNTYNINNSHTIIWFNLVSSIHLNNNNNNTQQNSNCCLYGDRDETVDHIISKCRKEIQK